MLRRLILLADSIFDALFGGDILRCAIACANPVMEVRTEE
jgi:hypothetical protein